MLKKLSVMLFLTLIGSIAVSNISFAIKIIPEHTEIKDYSANNEYIITIINDESKFEDIKLTVDPLSKYLSSYITIEPQSFTLLANDKKNVKIKMRFPTNLSPEKHEVIIDSGKNLPSTMFSFKVEGIARPNLVLENVDFKNVTQKQNLYVTISLNNKGNVIARCFPKIDIFEDDVLKDTIEYKYMTMVLPGQKTNLTLGYDTSSLNAGKYSIISRLVYNKNLTTNEINKELTIFKLKDNSKKENRILKFVKDNYMFFVFLIVVIIGLRIMSLQKKNSLEKHIEKSYNKHTRADKTSDKTSDKTPYDENFHSKSDKITDEQRTITTNTTINFNKNHDENNMDKESINKHLNIVYRVNKTEDNLKELITETESFINESNKWFKEKFGDKYKFG